MASTNDSVTGKSVIELAESVKSGSISAAALVDGFLRESEVKKGLNALTFVNGEGARASALEIDEKVARGETVGRLLGVPIAVKDAICTRGVPTTAGSKILQQRRADGSLHPWRPPYDATAVARLKAEGAIVLSKTNMDEFAMGSSNETSAYGPVKNPWAEDRVPGGSSGGSAVAVAADLAAASLGSDTGGSIRQPAAFCGVVGVKPSFGLVSRYGLIAYASSLDQIGPLTRDVKSSARLLEVMAGHDPRDSTSASGGPRGLEAACDEPLTTTSSAPGMRFGLPEEYFAEGLDPKIRARIDEVVEKVRQAGCEVKKVKLPHTHFGVATYYIVATAEASSNLSRFDGVRFGLREEAPGATLEALYAKTREAGFGAEVKRRILLGTYVLSAGYYDAYYGKAQKVRTLIARDFEAVFSEVDALLAPTTPSVAFRLGEHVADPLAMYLADVYTLPPSLAGICAASVPIGTVEESGVRLPVGLQVMSPKLGERALFRAAAGIERLVAGA